MTTIPTTQYRIGIIGAAIAGPVFALQILSHPILRQRFKPVLFDRSTEVNSSGSWEHQQSAGAAVAIFANGLFPLYQLGLEDELQAAGHKNEDFAFWDASRKPKGAERVGEYRFLGRVKHVDGNLGLVALERRLLQSVLIEKVKKLGGEVYWNMHLTGLETTNDHKVVATFGADDCFDFDLVVGADGAFSKIRKYILEKNNPNTAEERWLPDFQNAIGIYGVSSGLENVVDKNLNETADTHGLWLENGSLSTSVIGPGKMRWDLMLPEASVPQWPGSKQTIISDEASNETGLDGWRSRIVPAVYPHEKTIQILQDLLNVYHPATLTFGTLLDKTDRIIHTPLRQRVWNEYEIQHRAGLVLIGDASRTMLPSSGQGTSFAIEDATVLADALLNHTMSSQQEPYPFEAALTEYAKQRVSRSKRMASVAAVALKMALGETWYWRCTRYLSTWLGSFSKEQSVAKTWPFSERASVVGDQK